MRYPPSCTNPEGKTGRELPHQTLESPTELVLLPVRPPESTPLLSKPSQRTQFPEASKCLQHDIPGGKADRYNEPRATYAYQETVRASFLVSDRAMNMFWGRHMR